MYKQFKYRPNAISHLEENICLVSSSATFAAITYDILAPFQSWKNLRFDTKERGIFYAGKENNHTKHWHDDIDFKKIPVIPNTRPMETPVMQVCWNGTQTSGKV